jgi:hypothetical protein
VAWLVVEERAVLWGWLVWLAELVVDPTLDERVPDEEPLLTAVELELREVLEFPAVPALPCDDVDALVVLSSCCSVLFQSCSCAATRCSTVPVASTASRQWASVPGSTQLTSVIKPSAAGCLPPGVNVGVGVAVAVWLGLAVGVSLGVADGVALGVADAFWLGFGVGVSLGVAEGVSLGVADGVSLGVAGSLGRGLGEIGVGVDDGLGAPVADPAPRFWHVDCCFPRARVSAAVSWESFRWACAAAFANAATCFAENWVGEDPVLLAVPPEPWLDEDGADWVGLAVDEWLPELVDRGFVVPVPVALALFAVPVELAVLEAVGEAVGVAAASAAFCACSRPALASARVD